MMGRLRKNARGTDVVWVWWVFPFLNDQIVGSGDLHQIPTKDLFVPSCENELGNPVSNARHALDQHIAKHGFVVIENKQNFSDGSGCTFRAPTCSNHAHHLSNVFRLVLRTTRVGLHKFSIRVCDRGSCKRRGHVLLLFQHRKEKSIASRDDSSRFMQTSCRICIRRVSYIYRTL